MTDEIVQQLNEFRNEALCRHEPNQHKARKIWKLLKPKLTTQEVTSIEDDWSHYTVDICRETEYFGDTIKAITEKYAGVGQR